MNLLLLENSTRPINFLLEKKTGTEMTPAAFSLFMNEVMAFFCGSYDNLDPQSIGA